MTQQTRKEVQSVLLITLVLNWLVAFGKIVLGLATGTLAITADGFHSLTDGAGNIAGLIGNALAQRPPDDDHPYGHRRFETMAALLIAAFLLFTAWEMVGQLLERLRANETPEISPLVFVVLAATLVVNIGVSRYQIRQGERLRSEILLADARNTSADVFVTLSVIASTAIVSVTGWVWVDVIAAGVVVLLIGRAAWAIVQDTGRVLVDTAPHEATVLREIIADVPYGGQVTRARSRGPLDAAHIDIDLTVPPEMTTDQSESIAEAIRQRLDEALDGVVEVEVHFAPDYPEGRDAVLTARALADARGLSTHEVQIANTGSGYVLEMHVEVPPQLTLVEAHEMVTALEHEVCTSLPQIARVVSHIEPKLRDENPIADQGLRQQATALSKEAQTLLCQKYPQLNWYNVNVRPAEHGFAIHLHVALPARMTIEAAHKIAEDAELLLRSSLPHLSRITIHTEPYDRQQSSV